MRVLIADDDLMRAGLIELLTADAEIEIAGQASTGREAVEQARRLVPDVVLMDVRMPDLDGIAATRELLRATAEPKVLILTTFEQDDYIFGACARAPPASCSNALDLRSSSRQCTPSPPATRCCLRRSPGV